MSQDLRNPATDERFEVAVAVETVALEIREALAWLGAIGIRGVQWPAMRSGVRPRDLDASGRRDLQATLRRQQLVMAGVDLWIPPEHFVDPTRVDRAVAAVEESLRFAAEFGRVPVSLRLPSASDADSESLASTVAALVAIADRLGVSLADHAEPSTPREGVAVGIDPVAVLAGGKDPCEAVFAAAGALAAARLADLDRGGLRSPLGESVGERRLDPVRYRVALEVAGFRGLVVIDPRQWRDPRGGVLQTARLWMEAGRPAGLP